MESGDFLLQVVLAYEYSFDCRKFARQFPDIIKLEETVVE
jgi:hypothetical protein